MQGARKRAREQLHRHGFDYKKRCRLMEHASNCIPSLEKYGKPLFGGVVRFERMHVYFINFTTYLMELLVECVPTGHHHRIHKVIKQCHQFRNPLSGVAFPRLPHLLKLTHLTAERRVMAIFYWAHVLGTQAEVIIEQCRVYAKAAVATLQLLLIATRGRRAYTSDELDIIFKSVGTEFFRNMEQMSQCVMQIRYRKQQADHRRDPDKHRAPVPWTPDTRDPDRYCLCAIAYKRLLIRTLISITRCL